MTGSSAEAHAAQAQRTTIEDSTVFAEEQEHLTHTYATLRHLEKLTDSQIKRISEQAAGDKLSMAEEVAINFATDDDIIETYAEIATMNRVVDAYNMSYDINVKKLSDIHRLLEQPYFAKVVLTFDPEKPPREVYIGNAGVSDGDGRRIIMDWRSPVAETYYNQGNGPMSYEANGRTINVDLKLRRQFDIDRDTLLAYFDTTVAIEDALLLASLTRQRTAHMQAITSTIQKEQNLIVRHEDVDALLVNGIAGSGKTSVMMQRIAYVLYHNRTTLDPEHMVLMSPNPVFSHYIDHVLPDMGERNPQMLTWNSFAERVLQGRSTIDRKTSVDDLAKIDEACADLTLEPSDFMNVDYDGITLVSAQSIRKIASGFSNVAAGPRRITLIREEVERRARTRLAQMAAQESLHDELASLSLNEQHRLFGGMFDVENESEARRQALAWLTQRYEGAFKDIADDAWLSIDRIGKRLLGTSSLSPLSWLYLKMVITGLGEPDVRYVMVDEVQDYTPAQLTVLTCFYRNAHFLALGDPNQAIDETSAAFEEIREVFERARGDVSECGLNISYRCTPGITDLFAPLARTSEDVQIESVQREEKAPQINICADEDAYMLALCTAVKEAQVGEDLCALITPHRKDARRLARQLQKAGIEKLIMMDDKMELPESGVIITPLKLAKGLEFDHVIVADASERTFGEDDLSRRRLYTTLSRATRTLTVLSRGPLTPWLRTTRAGSGQ